MGDHLDKLLRFTDAAPAEDEAHELLMKECPWYQAVAAGEPAVDPEAHCKPAKGSTVKLTPETPEASTVVKPTVPPGGPGLFHVKGMHLPPLKALRRAPVPASCGAVWQA